MLNFVKNINGILKKKKKKIKFAKNQPKIKYLSMRCLLDRFDIIIYNTYKNDENNIILWHATISSRLF